RPCRTTTSWRMQSARASTWCPRPASGCSSWWSSSMPPRRRPSSVPRICSSRDVALRLRTLGVLSPLAAWRSSIVAGGGFPSPHLLDYGDERRQELLGALLVALGGEMDVILRHQRR